MKIIILGAGEVGVHIASSLRREGHDLVLIEKSADKVKHLQSSMDILVVAEDGCNPKVLKAHGAGNADLFFAVTNNDPVNLLATVTARRLGAKRCVVRVGNPDFGANPLVKRDDDIVLLYPERLVADEIYSLTRVPGAIKARFLSEDRLLMLHARPSFDADIFDRPIKELQGPDNWILTGIHRGSDTLIPRGDTVLRRGDTLYGVGPTDKAQDFLGSLGIPPRPVRRVVIAGAGQVGACLAAQLVREKVAVTLINRNKERADQLAADVPEALVLQGDATHPEILREAGTEGADYFVAATQTDEVNLLSCLLAREMGVHLTVALYNQPDFLNLMRASRIDVPLSPRLMIAGHIVRMVHRREIVSLDMVEHGNAEVVTLKVPENARVLKKSLSRMHFPRTAIVGAVVRGDGIFVPGGDFKFEVGDVATVFTLDEGLPEIERMFRGR